MVKASIERSTYLGGVGSWVLLNSLGRLAGTPVVTTAVVLLAVASNKKGPQELGAATRRDSPVGTVRTPVVLDPVVVSVDNRSNCLSLEQPLKLVTAGSRWVLCRKLI